MSRETIARRYSTALADVVLETGQIDAVKGELAGWTELFRNSEELQTVFSNPAIAHLGHFEASGQSLNDGTLSPLHLTNNGSQPVSEGTLISTQPSACGCPSERACANSGQDPGRLRVLCVGMPF